MKGKFILWSVPGILLLTLFGWSKIADVAKQKQEIYLSTDAKVGGVVLKPGKYLVVHEHQGAKEGTEPCTFFYKSPFHRSDEVAKVRCRPSEGKEVSGFTMKVLAQPDGTSLIQSVQFAGSTEIHVLTP